MSRENIIFFAIYGVIFLVLLFAVFIVVFAIVKFCIRMLKRLFPSEEDKKKGENIDIVVTELETSKQERVKVADQNSAIVAGPKLDYTNNPVTPGAKEAQNTAEQTKIEKEQTTIQEGLDKLKGNAPPEVSFLDRKDKQDVIGRKIKIPVSKKYNTQEEKEPIKEEIKEQQATKVEPLSTTEEPKLDTVKVKNADLKDPAEALEKTQAQKEQKSIQEGPGDLKQETPQQDAPSPKTEMPVATKPLSQNVQIKPEVQKQELEKNLIQDLKSSLAKESLDEDLKNRIPKNKFADRTFFQWVKDIIKRKEKRQNEESAHVISSDLHGPSLTYEKKDSRQKIENQETIISSDKHGSQEAQEKTISSDLHGSALVYDSAKIKSVKLASKRRGLLSKIFGIKESNIGDAYIPAPSQKQSPTKSFEDAIKGVVSGKSDLAKQPLQGQPQDPYNDSRKSMQNQRQADTSIFGGKDEISRSDLRQKLESDSRVWKEEIRAGMRLSPVQRAKLEKEVFSQSLGRNISKTDFKSAIKKLNQKMVDAEAGGKTVDPVQHAKLRKEIKFLKKIGGIK